MKTSVLRYAAIGMASLSLAGFAAASTVKIDTTGADSSNQIELSNKSDVKTTNTNSVGVGNLNGQEAESGRVTANENTELNGVGSGNAENGNTTKTTVEVDNTGSNTMLGALAGASMPGTPDVTIVGTGHDSTNEVEVKNTRNVTVTNTNTVEVMNVNMQSAESGNVKVSENTKTGAVTSGAAKNTSNTETTIKL